MNCPLSVRWNFGHSRRFFVTAILVVVALSPACAQEPTESKTEKLRRVLVDKGLAYLAETGQSQAGTFSDKVGPGVTALAITSALRNGRNVSDPMVAEGLTALENYVKPDGGIYGNGRLKNYETCVAMLCFAEASKTSPTGRYDEILKRARGFVTGSQYGEANRGASDPWYGGVGYGSDGRPDLSNTGYFIEALRATESGPDDPAIQRALAFVSRCQNLNTKYNDTEFAAKIDDGGFYYEIPTTKIDPSVSDERYTANGGLRSYGSMGYTGLKSMIFAGLTRQDPRVKAVEKWITDHYSVEDNPGLGTAGLFYYYHTFAAGLSASGLKHVVKADGTEHDWKADLVSELAKRQNQDGSWANDNQRWFENDKNLSTSFALMALAYCR